MNDLQLQTAVRCLAGIDQILEAVERLNALGATIHIPPIAIRFQPSPVIHGENPYSALVNSMMTAEYKRRIRAQIEAEVDRRGLPGLCVEFVEEVAA